MDAAWEEALRVCKKTINEGEGAEQASIWTTIIAAFDPREPWAAPERDQPFVREAWLPCGTVKSVWPHGMLMHT